jgi:hypothetical protein
MNREKGGASVWEGPPFWDDAVVPLFCPLSDATMKYIYDWLMLIDGFADSCAGECTVFAGCLRQPDLL